MIYALSKLGPVKRIGLWRETLRPFLISMSLFGIGGTTTGIAREWNHYVTPCDAGTDEEESIREAVDQRTRAIEAEVKVVGAKVHIPIPPIMRLPQRPFRHGDPNFPRLCLGDEERVALVSGLVLSSLLFLSLTLTFLTGGRARRTPPFLQGGDADPTGGGSDISPGA